MSTCECGCGLPAPLAQQTRQSIGHVKGQPVRFRRGHAPTKFAGHREEDRGAPTPCWIWQGAPSHCGYGLTRHGAKRQSQQPAHRFYYERYIGPIPAGHDLHHVCGVRLCVNPDHLRPTTTVDHIRHHATLNWDAVADIRRRFKPRVVTRQMLAAEYGVSVSAIKKVLSGECWAEPQESAA